MDWQSELTEILADTDTEDRLKHGFDYMNICLRKAFQAGHREGALAAISQLPQNIQDTYEFDADVDKFWAEKSYRKWSGGDSEL
jgi:hypothetical protein